MDFTLFLIYLVLTPIVFGLIFRAIAKSRRSFAMPAAGGAPAGSIWCSGEFDLLQVGQC